MRPTMLVLAALAAAACTAKTADRVDSAAPAAATVAASDPAAFRAFADSAKARYVDAALKGDVDALGRDFADDAVVFPPNAKALRGRAEIRKADSTTHSAVKMTAFKLSMDDVIVSGDYAIETGTYDQTVQPKTGKAIHDVGKYIVVFKKQSDGSWKIIRDIYNSDLPAKM